VASETGDVAALVGAFDSEDEPSGGMRRELVGLNPSPAGLVRIATPPTIASHLLVPQLGRLRADYPDIEVEFASSNTIVDLGQLEADVAVRVVRPTEGDLVCRKLNDYRMLVACAPSVAAAFRDEPAALPWLTWDRSMAHVPEARWLAGAQPSARISLRASDLNTPLAAAAAGVGALLVAEPIGALHGGLVRFPLPHVQLPEGSLWLAAHQALVRVPHVAAVWNWLVGYFTSGVGAHLTLPDAI
jgi:DNA-binding transcriptional LysR family regulator